MGRGNLATVGLFTTISPYLETLYLEEPPAAPRVRVGEGGGKKGIIVKMLNLFLACVMQSLLPLLRC